MVAKDHVSLPPIGQKRYFELTMQPQTDEATAFAAESREANADDFALTEVDDDVEVLVFDVVLVINVVADEPAPVGLWEAAEEALDGFVAILDEILLDVAAARF